MTRIRFLLTKEDDLWPPCDSECLEAEPIAAYRFQIVQPPFFAKLVAVGDIVEAKGDGDPDCIRYVRTVLHSRALSISVVPMTQACVWDVVEACRDHASNWRCLTVDRGEAPATALIAISFNDAAAYEQWTEKISHLRRAEKISVAELCLWN